MLVLVSTVGADVLVGREDVLRALLTRLHRIAGERSRAGEVEGRGERALGGALGLVGEPGVGKSLLLARVRDEARRVGCSVLAARGTPLETHLPYAGLHQLLRPVLSRADALPVAQREALMACFAMADGVEVNPFHTSLAVLELVADVAAEDPLLLCLDDLDLVDAASLEVLGFVARRVETERVLLVCASRTRVPAFGDDSVGWTMVEGLDPDSSRALLDARSPGLRADVRDRVLSQAHGNPLALVEFAAAAERGANSWSETDAELPMTTRLEDAFAGRVAGLGDPERAVMLLVALDDGCDQTELLAAAESLCGVPISAGALHSALTPGLLEVTGDRYRVAHPLVGSAIRRAASSADLRRAHSALADVLAAQPDRAVWHRALATSGTDDDLAARLEHAANDARRRGAVPAALTWMERASALSSSPGDRVSRLLSAAELAYELGRFADVERMRAQTSTMTLTTRDQSRLTWLEGVFHDGVSSEPWEVSRLVDLARTATHDQDPDLAMQLLFGAARRVWWRDPGAAIRADIVRAAHGVPLPPRDPRVLAVLSLAESLEQTGPVNEQLATWVGEAGDRPDLSGLLGISAFCVGDFELASTFLTTAVGELRVQGRLGLLAEALAIRSWAELNLGVFDRARSADEAVRLADETGQAVWGATARISLAFVDAVSGHWHPQHPLLLAAEHTALNTPNASSSLYSGAQMTRGVADLGEDRPEQAYGELRRVFEPTDPAFQRAQQLWAISFLADAAVRTRRGPEARELLATLTHHPATTLSPSARVAMEYAAAVLADDASADDAFQAALAGAARRYPWHHARVQLSYGAWLRRNRRLTESREPLRTARETFAALGASTWADRADQELRASGETGWRPVGDPRERLSVQETQIAQLAAQGLSNREIGERLFLSHRTVGSHLYRIFPKLGVTNRMQLANILMDRAPAAG
jgi:DNA-binding NarL/FixJ family response regulator